MVYTRRRENIEWETKWTLPLISISLDVGFLKNICLKKKSSEFCRAVVIFSSSNIAKGWSREGYYPKNDSLSQIMVFIANKQYLHYFSGAQSLALGAPVPLVMAEESCWPKAEGVTVLMHELPVCGT